MGYDRAPIPLYVSDICDFDMCDHLSSLESIYLTYTIYHESEYLCNIYGPYINCMRNLYVIDGVGYMYTSYM